MERILDKNWLARVTKAYPMRIDAEGNLVTCPVFLGYTNDLMNPKKKTFKDDKTGQETEAKSESWGCTVVFPEGTNFDVPRKMVDDLYASKNIVRSKADGTWIGQKTPFLRHEDVGIDKKTGEFRTGYFKGGRALRVSTYKKPVVAQRVNGQNALVSAPAYDIVYDGVIALCVLNIYYSPSDKKKLADPTVVKGAMFGLKSVLILNSATPKWFEGGGKPNTIEDLNSIQISEDDVINFNTGDGFGPAVDDFGDDFADAFAAEQAGRGSVDASVSEEAW